MRHVEWALAAEATWKKLSMGDATLVAKAAVRFAETGQGDLEVISRDAKPTVRLRAGRFVLTIAVPKDEHIVVVIWLYSQPG
jgi:mRNA-degrading endonuclease RelE of RelBE toxin-antitoxin system